MESLFKTLEILQKVLIPVSQECALYESEQILQYIVKCSRSDLYLHGTRLLSNEENIRIRTIVEKRLSNEPLAYILGSVFFYSMEISVNRDVLIPRQETEILVDTVLKNESSEHCSFVDLGTGSGAIAAVLCNERPKWRGFGTDVSLPALKTAQQNCPSKKINLLCCNMISSIKISNLGKNGFAFIVCNPPYVSASEMQELDPGVSKYEPHVALLGGNDGMEYYRILAAEGKKILKQGASIYCEIGYNQGEKVEKIFSEALWKNINIIKDLANRSRVVVASCNDL